MTQIYSCETLSEMTVINASAAVTLLEQRPEKIQALSGMDKINFSQKSYFKTTWETLCIPSPPLDGVRAALCSWANLSTLTVRLSTQVYKWVLANEMLGGIPAID